MGLRRLLGSRLDDQPDQKPPWLWRSPERACMIAAVQRSGSNLLASAMHDTGALGYPAEYFNKYRTRRDCPDAAVTFPFMARRAVQMGTTPNGITSIKFVPYQFKLVKRHLQLERWFPRARWIWIQRHDRIAQAISFEKAAQTQAWSSYHDPRCMPVYSPEAIEARLAEIETEAVAWQRYFDEQGIVPLTLWYEDIEGNLMPALYRIAEHLSVSRDELTFRPSRPNPRPNISRQSDKINAEWRERFVTSGRPQ